MKYMFPLILAVLVLASCTTSGSQAAPAAASPVPAAELSSDEADSPVFTGLVADFESDELGVSTYKGGASSISAEVQFEVAHSGKGALVVDTQSADYVGAVISPDPGLLDWTGKTKLVFFMKGKGGDDKISVVLEDAGKEQFMTSIQDSSADWKEFSIPLARFKSRTDYQAGDAKVDKKIDYPLNSIHIFTSSTYKGVAYMDDVRVE